MIIDSLLQAIDEKNSPITAGLDPVIEQIPPFLIQEAREKHGPGQVALAEAYLRFNLGILEEIHPLVPSVKLQKACYEVLGAEGAFVFEATCQRAKELGMIVIDDSKRGDIGSTAMLYAKALLGEGKKSDYATVNPYLGWDGINPFVEVCKEQYRGIFLLVRTSNPTAVQYQEAEIKGRPLFEVIATDLEKEAQSWLGERGFSPLGAVVGATWPEEAARLREIMPHCLFLVPGYGAQGGSGKDVMPGFNTEGYGALINSSRGIIFAWQREDLPSNFRGERNFALAAAWAAAQMREDLLQSLKTSGKLPSNW